VNGYDWRGEKKLMNAQQKLEVLKEAYSTEAELDQVVGKLLDLTVSQYRQRVERYGRDLREFEQRYGLDSATFYRRFEAGELGDAMDFFEWAGVYELRQDLLKKIQHLESVR
jgi:hypothetical protein